MEEIHRRWQRCLEQRFFRTVWRLVTFANLDMQCGICFDSMCFNERTPIDCHHNFCKPCFRRYIRAQLENRNLNIKCPDPDCTNPPLTYDSLARFTSIDPALSQFLAKTALERGLLELPFIYACPTPNCPNISWDDSLSTEQRFRRICWRPGKYYIVDDLGKDMRRFCCNLCGYSYCILCRAHWSFGTKCHHLLSCQSYAQKRPRSELDEAGLSIATILRNNSQKCPKCQVWIEKSGGCRHMMCKWCSHHFCWTCRRPYNHCLQNVTCLALNGNRLATLRHYFQRKLQRFFF